MRRKCKHGFFSLITLLSHLLRWSFLIFWGYFRGYYWFWLWLSCPVFQKVCKTHRLNSFKKKGLRRYYKIFNLICKKLCSLLPAVGTNASWKMNVCIRAATYNYFHYSLIIIFTINRSFHEMSEKCEKCSTQSPRAQCNVFRLLLLSKQQHKTQRLHIYYH